MEVILIERPIAIQSPTYPRLIDLESVTAEQVAEMVKANPHVWLNVVLPAIVEGVFDGAEAVCWSDGEGNGDLAISLVQTFDQRERVRRWRD